MSEIKDVLTFHKKFNQIHADSPVFVSQRLMKERFNFLMEELNEFWSKGVVPSNMEEIADGLIDLVYVAKGTAVMLGLAPAWKDLWDDVQRANMAKVPKVTHRGTSHDVGKPEGWVGPKTLEILMAHGFNPLRPITGVDYPEFHDQPGQALADTNLGGNGGER